MLRVFHSAPWPAVGGELALDATESAHLVRVRRARMGEPVEVLDGQGGVAAGVLTLADPNAARLRMDNITRHPAPTNRVLAVGLPKGDGLGEIIRQATELGATQLQPLLTARTEVRLDYARVERKLERWRATALEACKQSGNPWLPLVSQPVELDTWLQKLPVEMQHHRRLVAALTPDVVDFSSLHNSPSTLSTLICVGPEGDFSPGEYAALKNAGFTAVRLPGHVLRVETACVAALTLLAQGG